MRWRGSTELRINLDINKIINTLDQLVEEAQDMTWQELWEYHGLSTGAEPDYASTY